MSPKIIILVISALYLVSTSAAIKCYTCGDHEEDKSMPCANFQFENPGYQRECGAKGKSCRMARKVDENTVLSRTCGTIHLNDCKTANSIEFCYCTKDLCNKISPSDDEEDEGLLDQGSHEGSGTASEAPPVIPKPNTSNQDLTVTESGETKRPNTQEAIENNSISARCSVRQVSWYLVSTTVMHFCLSMELS